MRRFLSWFGRRLATKSAPATRSRLFRPQLEQLDERLVPSALSSALIAANGEHCWYTVDMNTQHVVLYNYWHNIWGMVPLDMGQPQHGFDDSGNSFTGQIQAISASNDPQTGYPEVFVLAGKPGDNIWLVGAPLWRCDFWGNWHYFGWASRYLSISATTDGHVYAAHGPDGSKWTTSYLDSNGNGPNLGGQNVQVAASHSSTGNEVFAISSTSTLCVNSTNTPGQWQPVDDLVNDSFASLSATQDNTVFAEAWSGKLYQESWDWHPGGNWLQAGYFAWTSHDISAGGAWGQMSADLDAQGRSEVYAMNNSGDLYLYDNGWSWKASSVYDVSAAGGGVYYWVQHVTIQVWWTTDHYYAYCTAPTQGGYWTQYLGDYDY
jgi:hypothetical protein